MIATAPLTANRVISHPEPVAVPPAPAAYSDIVFAALMTLQAQLSDPDAAVARTVALGILDFEKTRMRHGQPVPEAPEVFAATSGSGVADPAPAGRGEEGSEELEEAEAEELAQVERIRARLQARAERGGGMANGRREPAGVATG